MGLGAADQPRNRVSRDDDYQIRALYPKFASRGNYHDSGGYQPIPKTRLDRLDWQVRIPLGEPSISPRQTSVINRRGTRSEGDPEIFTSIALNVERLASVIIDQYYDNVAIYSCRGPFFLSRSPRTQNLVWKVLRERITQGCYSEVKTLSVIATNRFGLQNFGDYTQNISCNVILVVYLSITLWSEYLSKVRAVAKVQPSRCVF